MVTHRAVREINVVWWLRRLPSEAVVRGSNPAGPCHLLILSVLLTFYFFFQLEMLSYAQKSFTGSVINYFWGVGQCFLAEQML